MALLGYARVSTSHQKLTAQIMELKSSGVRDDRIFTDMMSGATDEREGLQRLLARAEKDDIRHCCKVSDEAAFCLIQRPYISKTLLTRRISPGDHHNKMLRPGLCVVHASPQYL